MLTSKVLVELFSKDEDYLTKFHPASGKSVEECAEITLIESKKENRDSFLITRNGETVGFFVRENLGGILQCLTDFFIVPQFREDSTVWQEIDSRFLQQYYVGLYENNSRDIQLMTDKNAKQILKQDNKILMLLDNGR